MSQRRGAVLCSHCHKVVAADETECPWCGAKNPTLWGLAPALREWFGPGADTVGLITMACGALYLLSLAADFRGTLEGLSGGLFNLGSPSSRALYLLGMTGGYAWSAGHWWTLLTASWLHGSLLHIFFNLSWARSLGGEASRIFGPARFLVLWMLTGAAGFLASNVFFGSPTIGASASVFGVMGALIAFGRKRGGAWGRAVAGQVWTWAAISLAMGFMMPSVNNAAHVGGFLAGLVLGRLMPHSEESRESRPAQVAALVLIVLTLASFAASIVTIWPLLREG